VRVRDLVSCAQPSVFSEAEVTMPKDALHAGDVEHRDVHNGEAVVWCNVCVCVCVCVCVRARVTAYGSVRHVAASRDCRGSHVARRLRAGAAAAAVCALARCVCGHAAMGRCLV
jgi:hypothetical protein